MIDPMSLAGFAQASTKLYGLATVVPALAGGGARHLQEIGWPIV